MMLAYKVLIVNNGKLVSVIAPKPLQLTYAIDKWTKPKIKNSKLFVFKRLVDAKRWSCIDIRTKIFLCEVQSPIKVVRKKVVTDIFLEKETVEQYWSGNTLKYVKLGLTPSGTYMCDAIKLIKEII